MREQNIAVYYDKKALVLSYVFDNIFDSAFTQKINFYLLLACSIQVHSFYEHFCL